MAEYYKRATTMDQLEFPPVLYKYREAENPFHREILQTGKIFFPPPNGFEDCLDCKNPVRYDLLTDEDIFNKYYSELKDKHPTPPYNDDWVRAEANNWVRAGLMRNERRIKQAEEDYWEILNTRFGVLCLTADPANPAMWKKYGAELDGVCIGFDPKIMFPHLGGGGIVHYVDELPIIKPFDDYDEQHDKNVFHKLTKWDFEKEYRTHKLWPHVVDNDGRKIALPDSAFVEVIIGENVSPATKSEIISEARRRNPHINVYTAALVNGTISITEEK